MTDIEIPLGKRLPKYRFFEMLPALLSFGSILLPVILSLISSFYASVFIIGFIIMWFVKAIAVSYRTVQGYQYLEKAQRVDWLARLNDLQNPQSALKARDGQAQKEEWQLSQHIRNLQSVIASPGLYPKPKQIFNAVIIAIHHESREVIEPTLQALFSSSYDTSKLILVIGYEERGPAETHELAKELAAKYGSQCYHAAAIMHPNNLPGEVKGKGGNITNAGRYLQKYLTAEQINHDDVIVTTLDCDNRPHPAYLAYVTYQYIVTPERVNRAFQPIALFVNNIWDVPAPMRVLATGNSFWNIINSMRPYMLRNFAAHSQGMSSLDRTNLWSTRTIVEDGHQYWRSYFAFNGNYEVVPIYVPIYQDAVLADTYIKTMKAQFMQLRRWAYGASDVAYVADKGFSKGSKVPLWSFLGHFFRLLESYVSWASASIIITFGAWAPLIINPDANRSSLIAHELPQIASQLQFIAMFGLFITVYLSFKMLPPRPERYKRRRNVFMLAQWLMMPVISICYGSAAALYAQTRLLLGKYLDVFDATVKTVRKDN